MVNDQSTLAHPKYRPDIDGLRAVAVLSVVAYHAFPNKIEGGFVGVDIFFVISGYLISTIIFENITLSRFSFIEFYFRRIKRIFPALLVVLTSCIIFGWFVLFPEEFKQLGKHVLGGTWFVSNLILWSESGYFDSLAETKPLLHLWSLGIEEQFYIFWPLLVVLFWRSNFGFLISISIILLSFSLNIYTAGQDPVSDFYSPITRFWELSAGSFLAYLTLRNPAYNSKLTNIQSTFISISGFVLICLALYFTNRNCVFPGWWALLPVVGSMLLILAGNKSWLNRNILSSRIFVWIGLISFPLYLWHWPLLSFARIIDGETPDKFVRIFLVLLSVMLAHLTYVFIEKPIRFGSLSRYKILTILLSPMIIIGIVGLVILKTDLFYKSFIPLNIIQDSFAATTDWEYPGSLKKEYDGNIDYYVNKSMDPEVVLFGDSHIEQYGPRITSLTGDRKAKSVAFITGDGCPPIPNVYEDLHPHCRNFIQNLEGFLKKHPSVKIILISACWNCYFIEEASTEKNAKYDFYFKDEQGVEKFRGGKGKEKAINEFARFIKNLHDNYLVYILLDNPQGEGFNPKNIISKYRKSLVFSLNDNELSDSNKFIIDAKQSELENVMKQVLSESGATIYTQNDIICPNKLCSSIDLYGKPIYKDSNHIRPYYIKKNMSIIDSVVISSN